MSRLVCHGASLKTSRDKRLSYRMFIVKLASQQEHSEMPNGVFFPLSTFPLELLLCCLISPYFRDSADSSFFPLSSFFSSLLLVYDFFFLSFSYLPSCSLFVVLLSSRDWRFYLSSFYIPFLLPLCGSMSWVYHSLYSCFLICGLMDPYLGTKTPFLFPSGVLSSLPFPHPTYDSILFILRSWFKHLT